MSFPEYSVYQCSDVWPISRLEPTFFRKKQFNLIWFSPYQEEHIHQRPEGGSQCKRWLWGSRVWWYNRSKHWQDGQPIWNRVGDQWQGDRQL